MATRVYGTYVKLFDGGINIRPWFDYTITKNNNTEYALGFSAGIQVDKTKSSTVSTYDTCVNLKSTGRAIQSNYAYLDLYKAQTTTIISSASNGWTKTHSPQTITVAVAWVGNHTNRNIDPDNFAGVARKTFTIPAKTSYKITFNNNGGTGGPTSQTKWYGEDLTLSSSKPTRPGYTFKNWKSSSRDATYSPGSTVQYNGAQTLVAQWTVNKVTIKYNANNGTQGTPSDSTFKPISDYSQNKTYNNTINLIDIGTFALTRAHYHIIGTKAWNTSANGTGTSYDQNKDYTWSTFGSTTAASKTVTLYANWMPNTYTYKFNANGGTGAPGDQVKTYNKTLTLSSVKPTRSNYSFNKWNNKSDGTGSISYASGATIEATKEDNTTNGGVFNLYATWNPLVSFNANGGSGAPATQVKVVNDSTFKISSVVPVRSGYIFDKWKGSDNQNYQPGDSYIENTPLTLTAQWKKLPDKPQILEAKALRVNCFVTEDTTISSGKVYFERTIEDGHNKYDVVTPESPADNPNAEGWYEVEQDDEGNFGLFRIIWNVDTQDNIDNPVYPQSNKNIGAVSGQCELINPTQSDVNPYFHLTGDVYGFGGTAFAITEVSTEKQYNFIAEVRDRAYSDYNAAAAIKSDRLTAAIFVMDFKAGGKAIGIGRAAPDDGLEIEYKTVFNDKVSDVGVTHTYSLNKSDTSAIKVINNSSNALTVDWNGALTGTSATFSGDVTDGSGHTINRNNGVPRGTVANNTNLNNVITRGIWWLSGNNTYTNAPTSYGLLEIYTAYNGEPSSDTIIVQRVSTQAMSWTRHRNSGTWSVWRPIFRFQDQMSITTHTISLTAAASSYQSTNIGISKSGGWYPVGIAGWYESGTAGTYMTLPALYLSDRAVGSATLNVVTRNLHTSSAQSITLTAQVLWTRSEL